MRGFLTEAEFERLVDGRVQRRLRTDPRYRHAEDAEAQRLVEERVTRDVERELAYETVQTSDRG